MDFEDRLPAFEVRLVDRNLTVEAAGTKQGGIEHVGTFGSGQYDDPTVPTKSIHFNGELIERSFTLVIAHDRIFSAGPPDGIDLIDKNDTRRFFPGLFEKVSHPAGTNSDEELDEVGTTHGEEGHLGLTRHRFRQQRLTRPGRTYQQSTLWYLSAECGIFFWILQEIDDLHPLDLGFIQPRHIIERYRDLCSLVE